MKISNSEGLAVGSCERKWAYAFHPAFHLEPKYQSIALVRGLIGHEALQKFFEALQAEKGFIAARKESTDYLVNKMLEVMTAGDINGITAVTELIPIMDEYYASEGLETFLKQIQILGVEVGFETDVAPGLTLAGRVDLLVYFVAGPYKGETVPVDNKFVYNFWSEWDFKLNSQMPSYIHTLKRTNPERVIRRALINQLRHRSNAQERFTMTPIIPEKGEVAVVIDNHVKLSNRVKELYEVPNDQIIDRTSMTLSKYSCGNCGFKSICRSVITGGDTKSIIEMDYQPNTYGYREDEDIEV